MVAGGPLVCFDYNEVHSAGDNLVVILCQSKPGRPEIEAMLYKVQRVSGAIVNERDFWPRRALISRICGYSRFQVLSGVSKRVEGVESQVDGCHRPVSFSLFSEFKETTEQTTKITRSRLDYKIQESYFGNNYLLDLGHFFLVWKIEIKDR